MFNFLIAVFLLTFGDVIFGKYQVIDNGTSICPGLEQVVAFEKRVMPIAGVCHYQRLHGDSVFFHQVSNTRIGIDHYLVGQPHVATAVLLLSLNKLFAEGPVRVIDGHAYARIGVHHLLSGDHFYLVGVNIQSKGFSNAVDFGFVLLQHVEGPVRTVTQRLCFYSRICSH